MNAYRQQNLTLYVDLLAIHFSGHHNGLIGIRWRGGRADLDSDRLAGRGADAQPGDRQQAFSPGAQVQQHLSRLAALAVDDTGAAGGAALQYFEICQQPAQVQRVEILICGGSDDESDAVAQGHLLPVDSHLQRCLAACRRENHQ